MKALSRRVAAVWSRFDPAPDPAFLAYARAMVAWSGGEPDVTATIRTARDLARTRGGATWEGLVELARLGIVTEPCDPATGAAKPVSHANVLKWC